MSDMALNHSGIEGGAEAYFVCCCCEGLWEWPTLSVVAVRDYGSVDVRGK